MNRTIRHGLPLLAAGQAQKEVTHNEALLALDRRLQIAVASRRIKEPPNEPMAGDAYIVPPDAKGDWVDRSDRIASFDGSGWVFDQPGSGWLAWVADERQFCFFDGEWIGSAFLAAPARAT